MNEQNINPLYENSTITFTPSNTKKVISKQKYIEDPQSTIPNGIYKVIKWEIRRLLFGLLLSLIIFLSLLTTILIYAFVTKPGFLSYSLPVIISIWSLYNIFSYFISYRYTKLSIIKYREDLKMGISHTPVFIQKMYKNLYINQVRHNWLTFFIIFYLGIATLLLWWLKDVHWWILDFESLVNSLFSNVNLMIWIFTTVLITTIILQLFFMIHRKRKVLEIDAYFGEQIESSNIIEEIKATHNKSLRRIFFWSVLIILIIPLIIYLVLKVMRKKV